MSKVIWLLVALVCFPAVGAVSVKLSGVEGQVADNIEIYLQSLPEVTATPSRRTLERIEARIAEAMQAFGYFEPDITLRWEEQAASLTANIDPGEPVRLEQVDIRIVGEGSDDPVLRKLIDQSALRPGEVLHQGRYESLKSSLVNQALSRGYFDVRLASHEIRVSLRENSADIELVVDSGIRYHFGEVSYQGDRQLLDKVAPLRPFGVGDPFDNSLLGQYSQDLSDTGYFRSVVVSPQLDARGERAVPVQVTLEAPAANSVQLGGGYSTDVGVRAKVAWTKPRINDRGHSFTSSLQLSAPEQTLEASYKIPLAHPLKDFVALEFGWQRTDNLDTQSTLITLNLKRQWPITDDWSGTLFTRLEQEDYVQGIDEDKQLLLIPGISVVRTRSRGGLNPYWGDQQLASLELSDPLWASDARLAKVRLRSKWLRSIERRHKFSVRADLGLIASETFREIPASMRFFAGGDQSIRGFAYESVAPRDDNGTLLGGRYMAVGGLEYSYPVADKWALATFVDAGTVTNDFSEAWKVGTGIGVRWLTPVGPLKVDFAFAVSEPGSPFRLHITMGPQL